jgi:RecG-like helicase
MTMPDELRVPDGTAPIASVKHRMRTTVCGRIQSVRVQPRAGVATLQATLADDTGTITLVFLGRRHIPGIEPGAYLAASAVVGERGGRLELLNPDYQLLATRRDT